MEPVKLREAQDSCKISSFVMTGTSTASSKTILNRGKRKEPSMLGLEIIGVLGVLLLFGSFTALQFRWLTEIAKA